MGRSLAGGHIEPGFAGGSSTVTLLPKRPFLLSQEPWSYSHALLEALEWREGRAEMHPASLLYSQAVLFRWFSMYFLPPIAPHPLYSKAKLLIKCCKH